MRYRMVVCDLDDTLLDSSGSGEVRLSQFTKDTIARFIDLGGIFTISTGRSMGSLLKQLSAFGLQGRDIPLMSLNGTYVINGKTGETLRDLYIDHDTALKVALECERLSLHYHLYDKDYAYVTDMHGKSRAYLEYSKSPAREVPSISKMLVSERPQCMKMLIMGEPDRLKGVAEHFSNLFPELNFLSSNPHLIEIISSESGKGKALEFIASKMNIPLSQVIAIGDSMNDYSMIEAAGLGIAMGNACDELKSIAKYVTDTCKNDGVAKAIRKFCF